MDALEKDVLETALEIQDELLGPTINFDPRRPVVGVQVTDPALELTTELRDSFHAINGLTNSSWFFHSPLQYWSCDWERIHADNDIIDTVNRASRQSTSVNVTLRHSIVFSGKRFEDHRLVAADSLVITLIHMLDSPVGERWAKKAEELASRKSSKWRIHLDDAPASTLYEFQFQPLSVWEYLWAAAIYLATIWYFFTRMSKLHALKSRLGLGLAVATQLMFSTFGSFVICAVLKIDLSGLPRESYPLVIIPIGLGSMFDFINAVIATSPRWSPTHRVTEAIGTQGPIILATVAQQLVILWTLPRGVTFSYYSPVPVMAFCKFAALALVLDFFFLMTFLVPIMSIDTQRPELDDALNHPNQPSTAPRVVQHKRRFWNAMIPWEKGLPISTRIAGQIVLVGALAIISWHFLDARLALAKFWHLITSRTAPSPQAAPNKLLSVDIHQARSPTAWLQMQDHETAKEVIQVVKPHATSYIARVYKPLTFILAGSDRTPNEFGVRPFLPAVYDFTRNNMTMFLISIIFTEAVLAVLMSYLLWNELPEPEDENSREDAPILSVLTLNKGHDLDIIHLASSKYGIIAAVGLDRRIQIWDVRQGLSSYNVHQVSSQVDPFPVLAIAIDSNANWLAFLSAKDQVFLWNIPEKRWGPSMAVEVKRRKPVAFFFGYDKEEFIDPIVIVRQNGLMSELHVESSDKNELQICRSPLVSVRRHYERPNATSADPPPRIITSSKKGCVHVASHLTAGWISNGIEIPEPADDPEILSVLPLPVLSSFLAVRKHTVDLIDIFSHRVTHTFSTRPMVKDSLRCFHSTRRRPQCGSVGLANLALAYTCAETGNCIMQSYLPEREGDTICFRDPWTPGSKTCCLWRETVENRYEVENPGKWEALRVGYLVGIRQREIESEIMPSPQPPAPNSGLRRRARPSRTPSFERDEDRYEVWSLSARGEMSKSPLFAYEESGHLFNSVLGEIEIMSQRSVAVALGNVVKIITIGNEKFDGAESEREDDAFVGMQTAPSRRKRPVHKSKKSA